MNREPCNVFVSYTLGGLLLLLGLTEAFWLKYYYLEDLTRFWIRFLSQGIGLIVFSSCCIGLVHRPIRLAVSFGIGIAIEWLLLQPAYYRAFHGPLLYWNESPSTYLMEVWHGK